MSCVKRVGIFGTSGMAREAGDIAWTLGIEPIFVARDEIELHSWGLPGQVILERDIARFNNMPYVIGIAESSIKKAVANRYRNQISFTNLIHPSATFGRAQRERIESSKGTIIAAGARFTSGIIVGDFCIFNQNITIAHDCIVDNFVHIAPGANVSGNVHLSDSCWVGAGAVINQGTPTRKCKIGQNAIVGSGAVVLEDCEPDATYVGIPARKIA